MTDFMNRFIIRTINEHQRFINDWRNKSINQRLRQDKISKKLVNQEKEVIEWQGVK